MVKRYRLFWAWFTLALYVVALPLTVIVFPANSLWLGLLVLFTGFTASLTTVGDLLVSAEEAHLNRESPTLGDEPDADS